MKLFGRDKTFSILWIEIEMGGAHHIIPHTNRALDNDPEFKKKLTDLVDYLKQEYEIEDFI